MNKRRSARIQAQQTGTQGEAIQLNPTYAYSKYTLIKGALLSRVVLYLIALVGSKTIGHFDASTAALIRDNCPDPNFIETSLIYFFEPYLRWDAVYFHHISLNGYVFEQEYAFFPLVPTLISGIAKIVRLVGIHDTIVNNFVLHLVLGVLINHAIFIVAVLVLALFASQVSQDNRLSFVCGILFALSPAGIFLSSIYTESSFALFSFAGMHQWLCDHDVMAAGMFFIAGLARSNGLLDSGFFMYSIIVSCMQLYIQGRQLITTLLISLMRNVFCILLCLSSFAIVQKIAYDEMCLRDPNPQSEWCTWTIPLVYSYVQKHYWNNGFLSYWELKQFPNFLLAAPMVMLSVHFISRYLRSVDVKHLLQDKLQLKTVPFYVLWLGMVVYCVLFMHVQVITRFLTSMPMLYVELARLVIQDDTSGTYVVKLLFLYALCTTLAFGTFYPPA
ncbi:hypothetical protein MIR68_008630 [Amoeboaphelidium protococcarum]|nr:hypothetical protein MIR68_008630 [Amoeboaphelidium protococcarum]